MQHKTQTTPVEMLAHERRRPTLLAVLALGSLALIALLCVVIVGAITGEPIISLPDFGDAQPARVVVAANSRATPPMVAPPSDPAALEPLSAPDALAANAAIPFAAKPNPAARAFVASPAKIDAWQRSVECLSAAAFYEAAGEGESGMRAVVQVVLNRVRHPAFPKTVCGVVFQGAERRTGCQFTFTCDGSLARAPPEAGWARARQVATSALAGSVDAQVGLATHYHTQWVLPYWAESLDKNAVVGSHIFYRWSGGWGEPAAFRAIYTGAEPDLPWLAGLPGGSQAPTGMPVAEANVAARSGQSVVVPGTSRQMIGTVAPIQLTPARPVARQERWVIGAPPFAAAVPGTARPIDSASAVPKPTIPASGN